MLGNYYDLFFKEISLKINNLCTQYKVCDKKLLHLQFHNIKLVYSVQKKNIENNTILRINNRFNCY